MNPPSSIVIPQSREWLETDGLGGFASGTATGIRTRRYHALLLTAVTPPTGRMVLVNGFDAWLETAAGRFALSSQCYAPDVLGGDGAQRIEAFGHEPWPFWIFKAEDGTRVELEIFSVKGRPMTCLSWKLLGVRREAVLTVRPFLSGRDYHALHRRNPSFRFDAEVKSDRVIWKPYDSLPGIAALTNAGYTHRPHWYYNFLYEAERDRGLDCVEDLAAPGELNWNLADGKAALILTTAEHAASELPAVVKPVELFNRFRKEEQQRREQFSTPLHKSADDYLVNRGKAKTVVAGYPWFTDWGRDAFIALRGLCLATGRLNDARDILLAWADSVSEGMLPNRFPDSGEKPEYNSVDASLWYIVAVHEYLRTGKVADKERQALLAAVEAILDGYSQGTRFGIRADADGLLACGITGSQLTWMDAKVGDWVVTPRIGKPVEVQALWLNALKIGAQFSARWEEPFDRGLAAFRLRFWNESAGCLYDVIDCDHQTGTVDATFRPNQIFAIGGLPFSLLEPDRALRVVAAVEARLWVPPGLRSLAPGEPGYTPRYEGGVRERDAAYHQGTVWPWLIGPFVEAWVRVRGGSDAVKREARVKFLAPVLAQMEAAGLGHISEITDAEAPHTPRGCPFQAWSVGEALRLDRVVLAESPKTRATRTAGKPAGELVVA